MNKIGLRVLHNRHCLSYHMYMYTVIDTILKLPLLLVVSLLPFIYHHAVELKDPLDRSTVDIAVTVLDDMIIIAAGSIHALANAT